MTKVLYMNLSKNNHLHVLLTIIQSYAMPEILYDLSCSHLHTEQMYKPSTMLLSTVIRRQVAHNLRSVRILTDVPFACLVLEKKLGP